MKEKELDVYQIIELVLTDQEFGCTAKTYVNTYNNKEEAQKEYNELVNNILPDIIKLDHEFEDSFYEENKSELKNEYIKKTKNECEFKSNLFNITKFVNVKLVHVTNNDTISLFEIN